MLCAALVLLSQLLHRVSSYLSMRPFPSPASSRAVVNHVSYCSRGLVHIDEKGCSACLTSHEPRSQHSGMHDMSTSANAARSIMITPSLSALAPQVLSWIDICAGLAAKTVARGPVVTASVDTVHFLRPCRLGSVVIVAAMVNRTFQSSMEARACSATSSVCHLKSILLTCILIITLRDGNTLLMRMESEGCAHRAWHQCCGMWLLFL